MIRCISCGKWFDKGTYIELAPFIAGEFGPMYACPDCTKKLEDEGIISLREHRKWNFHEWARSLPHTAGNFLAIVIFIGVWPIELPLIIKSIAEDMK